MPGERQHRNERQKRERAHKVNDSQKRPENQPVRPTRTMREKRLIRIPQKTKNAPARVLLRVRIQIGTEHQTAERKSDCYKQSKRKTADQFPCRRKNGRDEQKCDGVVCFS